MIKVMDDIIHSKPTEHTFLMSLVFLVYKYGSDFLAVMPMDDNVKHWVEMAEAATAFLIFGYWLTKFISKMVIYCRAIYAFFKKDKPKDENKDDDIIKFSKN